jgi:hypothetical protein
MPYHSLHFEQDIFDAKRLRLREKIKEDFEDGSIDGVSFDVGSDEPVLEQMKNSFMALDEWRGYLSAHGVKAEISEPSTSSGRYTLDDATKAITRETNEDEGEILERLVQAVHNESLPVYPPCSEVRYYARHVRPYYEEAHWDDLNKWLDTSIRDFSWRFPRPIKYSKSKPPFPNPPLRKDTWYKVLEDMMYDYKRENGGYPNRTEAWSYLSSGEPKSYGITTGTDRDEEALFISGAKALSFSAFKKRWDRLFSGSSKAQ